MAADRTSYPEINKKVNDLYESLSTYDVTHANYDGGLNGYNYNPSPATYQIGRTFTDTFPNTSVKSNFSRDDYEYFNGNESNPRNLEQKILLSMRAYDRVGIVRNVIDLMSDFTCKGIQITHPNLAEQKFFNEWWTYIDGDMISERFVNYLYRMANVPVSTSYGKVPVRIERKWTSSTAAVPYVLSPDEIQDVPVSEVKYENRRIPLRYNFINPLSLQVIAPDLAVFTGKLTFGLRVNSALRASMGRLQFMFPNTTYKEMMALIPAPIAAAIKDGKTLIPIDNENISVYYYRKDDWDVWAKPMISAIFEDLVMLEKLKLADLSALNGAISNVRLWRVGRMEGDNPLNWVIPTKANIAKVRAILAQNVGGGTLDMVWGPDIDFKESASQVHHFLGADKYQPVLSNIYDGLGVPFGNTGMAKGMTNSFISMQTFVERLEYGRRVLENFWNEQIKIVQLAMGYSKPAVLTFDQINLGDDTTYKQLLLGLVDRDLLSAEAVLENFGYRDDIEKIKIKRDTKKRASGKIPPKASPFHDPQADPEQDMKSTLLQQGGVAPSQVGLDLPPPKAGEKPFAQQQHEQKLAQDAQKAKFKPVGKSGRPGGSKDGGPRKKKTPPVQTKASQFTNLWLWGNEAQKRVSDIVTPILLATAFNKSTVRSLSVDEFEDLETFKFEVFSNLQPFEEVTSDRVKEISEGDVKADINVVSGTKVLLAMFKQKNQREPSVDEMRQIQSSGYALAYEPDNNDADIDNEEAITPTETEFSLTL